MNALSPKDLPAAIDACYKKYWAERNVERVDKPEVLAKLLEQVLGEDLAKNVMVQSTTPEGKKALNANSDEAVKAGAFGLPWMVGELSNFAFVLSC